MYTSFCSLLNLAQTVLLNLAVPFPFHGKYRPVRLLQRPVNYPQTTPGAVLGCDFFQSYPSSRNFSLYAEALRRNGLAETVQQKYRVMIAGPTTLAALLNSLQLGFRTLAIQKRSSEVWALLGGVKTEFGKYAILLEKVGKKLQEASNTVEEAKRRTRAIGRKLREVESPSGSTPLLLETVHSGGGDSEESEQSASAS